MEFYVPRRAANWGPIRAGLRRCRRTGFDVCIEHLKEVEARLVRDEKGIFGVGAREIVIAQRARVMGWSRGLTKW